MAGPATFDPAMLDPTGTVPTKPTDADALLAEAQGKQPVDDTTDTTGAATGDDSTSTGPAQSMEEALREALGMGATQSPPGSAPSDADSDGSDGGDGSGEVAADLPTPAPTAADDDDLDDGEEATGRQGEQAAPSSTPPAPIVDPATGVVDLNTITTEFYGRPLTQAEAYNLFTLGADLSRLTPEQARAVEAIIYGDPQATNQPIVQPQPITQPVAPVAPVEFDADLDPEIAKALGPIQQQLASQQAFIEQQSRQQLTQQQQQASTQIRAATEAFTAERQLTAQESNDLQQAVLSSGIFQPLYVNHGGDAAAAMTKALDTLYWQTPTFREREVAKQLAVKEQQIDETVKKSRKAGALAPGGAAVSREDPPPTTREGRQAAMVSEIAKAMEQS